MSSLANSEPLSSGNNEPAEEVAPKEPPEEGPVANGNVERAPPVQPQPQPEFNVELNNAELINAVIAPVPQLSPREQIHFLNEIFHYDDDSTEEIDCDCSDCEEERRAIERAKVSLDSDSDCDCTSCLMNCACPSCRLQNRTAEVGPPCKRRKLTEPETNGETDGTAGQPVET